MKRWLFGGGIVVTFVLSYFYLGEKIVSMERRAVLAPLQQDSALTFSVPGVPAAFAKSRIVDTMYLTDEPGNWFRSGTQKVPISIIKAGEVVEFDAKRVTDAKHTVTILVQPNGSTLAIDQQRAHEGTVRVQFTEEGAYLFACKVHPYMAGIVAVEGQKNVMQLTISGAELGFIDRLDGVIGNGQPSLPATVVAGILTVLAPFDSDATNPLAGVVSLGKVEKWDLTKPTSLPATPGVGEVWVDTQFEAVPGQTDKKGNLKPGTIVVLDAATGAIKNKIDGVAGGGPDPGVIVGGDRGWNNPHNMWTDVRHNVVYNSHWFGQWLTRLERESGTILNTIKVGFAPTHIVTIPNETSSQFGTLTLPLSAERDILKIEDEGGKLRIKDKIRTGSGPNHPHGQWITADGSKILIPNVFQGIGLAGSVTVMNAESGGIIREITNTDADGGQLLLPVAVGIKGNERGYVANIGTGTVSVIDLTSLPPRIINDIRVACFNPVLVNNGNGTCQTAPPGTAAGSVLDTLKLPIQTPPSPDGRWVVTAVFSLASGIAPDTIAVIDTKADGGKGALVAELPAPAGAHGVNWGAKKDGGYYAYVTSQHSNVVTIVDPDPDGDGSGTDATIAGQISLRTGAGVPALPQAPTIGVGGQGILPLPLVKDGWIQDTVAESEAGNTSAEINGFITALMPCQKNPVLPGCPN